LDAARKWEICDDITRQPEFYSVKDEAVSKEEIEAAAQTFREKPQPLIRRTIALEA
jgi:hypothetical protein